MFSVRESTVPLQWRDWLVGWEVTGGLVCYGWTILYSSNGETLLFIISSFSQQHSHPLPTVFFSETANKFCLEGIIYYVSIHYEGDEDWNIFNFMNV